LPPAPPAPPPDPPYAPGASSYGDPHLNLAHGARADFRGRHGGIFNFLSASSLSVNVRIVNSSFALRVPPYANRIMVHGTMISEVYVVGRTAENRGFRLTYAANPTIGHGPPTVTATCTPHATRDGEKPRPVLPGSTAACDELKVNMATRVQTPGGLPPDEHDISGATMTFTAPDWRLTVAPRPVFWVESGTHQRLDLLIDLQSPEDKLPTMPHGIIGQSWDGDGLAVDGQLDAYPTTEGAVFTTYAMAEGALEGSASDYEVAAPFDTQFKFSRFGTSGAAARDKARLVTCYGTDTSTVGTAADGPGQVGCRGAVRTGTCLDTPHALVGLQPLISLGCSPGLAEVAQHEKLGMGLTLPQLCAIRASSFVSHIAPLGIPHVLPGGFALTSTWADICPETCREHGVLADCLRKP